MSDINPIPQDRLKDIFNQALELPETQQASFIAQQTAGDEALHDAVARLLDSHRQAQGFLDRPTLTLGAAPSTPVVERIGPYQIARVLGEGGFGTVYLAEQRQPVGRQVAVKVLKPGMDSRQILARFNAERQTLALMDHPNIARVLDAGVTDAGRPYFVMEYVDGPPITDYCDRKRLSMRDRLALFADVCNAVHHAHQKGIIHRDIKPSNVLVTERDNAAVAKVIDFGVSKAMQQAAGATLMTDARQLIGTPEYMSPEQARFDSLDIDTRADVYSLGVLLYELLTGSTPFDSRQLRAAALAEMQRIIREVDPPRPSSRLSRIETVADIATMRQTEPRRLASTLRGELDWIVMKCLEKDRQRRYGSAAALAADVGHYLANQPVEASPPSTTYRLRKLVARNRLFFATAAVVVLSLVGTVAALAWGIGQVRAERDRTKIQLDRATAAEARERQQREQAEKSEGAAKAQTAKAETVTSFLTGMLESTNATNRRVGVSAGKDVTVRTVLDETIRRIDAGEERSLHAQPLLEATVRATLGKTLSSLGLYPDAERQLRRAIELREQAGDDQSLDYAAHLNDLAMCRMDQASYADAEILFRRSVAIYAQHLGAEHLATIIVENNFARALRRQHKFAEAEVLYRKTLDHAIAADPQGLDVAVRSNNLGMLLLETGNPVGAAEMFQKAVDLWRARLPPNHPDLAKGLTNLGTALAGQNKHAEALPYMREALEIRQAVLDADHPDIAVALQNYGGVLQNLDRAPEAEGHYRTALAIFLKRLDADHPNVAQVRANLAMSLALQKRFEDALAEWQLAYASRRKTLGMAHPQTLINGQYIAQALLKLGRKTEAEVVLQEVLAERLKAERRDEAAISKLRGLIDESRSTTQPTTTPATTTGI